MAKELWKKFPKEYNSYRGMKARCLNRSDESYKDYGRRGIKICKRWLGRNGFEHFLEDMGPRPIGKHGKMCQFSIDRIDPNDDYCKENCIWGDWYDQAAHRRTEGDVAGVYFNKERKTFVANIQVLGKRKTKSFKKLEDAINQRISWLDEIK